MEHAPQAGIVPDDLHAVPMGLPVMNNDRLIQLQGQVDLTAKQGLLLLLMAGVPVIVQADLSDGHAFGVGRQHCHLLKGFF